MPDECEWVVWVDPPPPTRVGLAFEEMHAAIERSWIRSYKLEKTSLELAKKNRALMKELKGRKEMMLIWTLLFPVVVVVVVVCVLAISVAVCAQQPH